MALLRRSDRCYFEEPVGRLSESRSMPQRNVRARCECTADQANIYRQAMTGMQIIILSGKSGQHASVVTEAAKLSGKSVNGFLAIDDHMISSIPECTSLGKLSEFPTREFRNHAFVVACGSNAKRKEIVEFILLRGARLESIVHPSAIISPSATIGSGSMILAGSVIGPSAVIGLSCIVNHCASVDHHCRLGDYVNISPGARLGGAVELGDEVFLGLNASILPGMSIGARATIGAGAVVLSNVAPSSIMVGIPAVPLVKRP